jgi:D-alanine-D-alanine ligase
MRKKQYTTILFGGSSDERLVSVASAQNLSQHFPEAKLWFLAPLGEVHEVTPSELAAHQNPFVIPFKPRSDSFAGELSKALELLKGHYVLLALHGAEGEDGKIQALLENSQIDFNGSGSQSSALCFDKIKTKKFLSSFHLSMATDLQLNFPLKSLEKKMLQEFFNQHKKIVLKPAANGSSFGLYIVLNSLDFQKLPLDNLEGTYLIEPFIEGQEITVGVWQCWGQKPQALVCSEVLKSHNRIFDYQGKYLGLGVTELTPASIGLEEQKRCEEMAVRAHELLGCKGYSRTDMILTKNGPLFLETNTLPGLTKASFIPQQLQFCGVDLRTFFLSQRSS